MPCDLQGDVLVSVNGIKVVNSKQAMRLITKSAERSVLQCSPSTSVVITSGLLKLYLSAAAGFTFPA